MEKEMSRNKPDRKTDWGGRGEGVEGTVWYPVGAPVIPVSFAAVPVYTHTQKCKAVAFVL